MNLTDTLNDGEDVSDDGMKFSITDGTGRDAIIFELDDDGVPSVGGSVTLYEASGRDLHVTGNYMGVEDREYFLEMDSENSFRWSLDGGATFNDEEIILTASSGDPNYSVAHPLSGGISVSLPMQRVV